MLELLPPRARLALVAYGVLATANVASELAEHRLLTTATKALLMPLLLVVLHATIGLRGRMARWVAAALVASWLGDLALTGSGDWFLAGLGAFFVAQVCYIVAFWPAARSGPLRRRPVLALPYLAWWVVLLTLLAPALDELLVPVTIYGLVLVTMAAAATGLGRLTTIGAALFVVSDSLIAATTVTEQLVFSGSGAAVMATYTIGQALIVVGVIRYVTSGDRDRGRQRGDDVGARS